MVSSRTAGGNSSRASCKQEHKYRRQLFVKLVPEETQLLCIDNCSLIKGTNVSQADLSHQKHTSLHETQLLHVCVCLDVILHLSLLRVADFICSRGPNRLFG